MGNNKSSQLNKLKAIRNKCLLYLIRNNIIISLHGLKQNEIFRLFLTEIGEEVPNGMSIKNFMYELYDSRKYSFLQSIMSRPDIPPIVWKNLKKQIFNKYGKVCLCCGSTEHISVDHIKPYSKFPELCIDFDNLQPLCRSCNSIKGNRKIVDYRI
jgi:hypothetical protein